LSLTPLGNEIVTQHDLSQKHLSIREVIFINFQGFRLIFINFQGFKGNSR